MTAPPSARGNVGVFIGIIITLGLLVRPAYAAVSCTASVTPTTTTPNVSGAEFTFTVTNTSPTPVTWMKVSVPSGLFTFQTSRIDPQWGGNLSDSFVELTGSSLGTNESFSFILVIATMNAEAPSANWTVEASDSVSGASPTTCTGSLGTVVSGSTDPSLPPAMYSVSVSDVGSSSVTVNWLTDKATSSQVRYGTSASYGSTKSDGSLVSSHSMAIDGLSANTTYHYEITSVDSLSQEVTSGDRSFTTAVAGAATSVPAATTAPTSAPSPTAVPSPTPVPDKVIPVVTLTKPVEAIYRDAPVIVGSAVDDKGIASVEYSIDDGKSWRPVKEKSALLSTLTNFSFIPSGVSSGVLRVKARAKDTSGNIGISGTTFLTLDTDGPKVTVSTNLTKPFPASPTVTGTLEDASGESSLEYSLDDGANWQPADEIRVLGPTLTAFTLALPKLDDGNYDLKLRAKDRFGSVREAAGGTIVIDRLPPRLGPGLFAIGPYILPPTRDRTMTVIPGITVRVTMGAVGGPTSVSGSVASDGNGEMQTVRFEKNRGTGLWEGSLTFVEAGRFTMRLHAVDGAGNEADERFASFEAVSPSRIVSSAAAVSDATVTVYQFDETRRRFAVWNASPYGLTNPQRVDPSGAFASVLPPGRYYIEVRGSGVRTTQTAFFDIGETQPLSGDISVLPRKQFRFGPFVFFWPELPWIYATTEAPAVRSAETETVTAIGTPQRLNAVYDLARSQKIDLMGKNVLLAVVSTWHPDVTRVMSQVSSRTGSGKFTPLILMPGESRSTVALFGKRGGFSIPILADPDLDSGKEIGFRTMPVFYLLSQKGMATHVMFGALPNNLPDLLEHAGQP